MTMPQPEAVEIRVEDRVGIIILNRPEALNAWNGDIARGLDTALRWASDADEVGAVVITGAGRAFCAGADLGAGGETFARAEERPDGDDMRGRTPQFLPWNVPKPVIAAVNGHAVGVGATYALACDLRIMAAGAKIGFVFTRRGMLPELASHSVLARVIGFSNAADLLLSGRIIDGAEAHDIGLASAVAPNGDQALALAIDRARDMAHNAAPVSMAITKKLLWEAMGVTEMMRREQPLFDWVALQPDSVEGVSSFLEKRAPQWALSVSRDFPHELYGRD